MTAGSSISETLDFLCRDARVPQSFHYERTQDYLREQIRERGLEPKDHFFWDLPKGKCLNIYAESGPSDQPRILIGAHYDSLARSGPGADDNASAVVVVLELMKRLPKDLPLTFVFFDVEENYGFGALHGSGSFCKFYDKPLQHILILDLVGGTFAPGLENSFFQFGSACSTLTNDKLEFFHLPMPFLEPVGKCGARSDYHAFRKRGIPFTFLSSGTPWYYHTPHDAIERLSLEKINRLIDTLEANFSWRGPQRIDGRWDNLEPLLERMAKTESLQVSAIQKLMNKKRPPNRLELVQLHLQILMKVRKLGPDLFS